MSVNKYMTFYQLAIDTKSYIHKLRIDTGNKSTFISFSTKTSLLQFGLCPCRANIKKIRIDANLFYIELTGIYSF